MLLSVWSFLMSSVLAVFAALWLWKILFTPRAVYLAILKAREVVMTQQEAERARQGEVARYMTGLIFRLQNLVDLEHLILTDVRRMLTLMGSKKEAEQVLAGFLLYALIGAVPTLLVPVVTGFYGYLAVYPVAVFFLLYQQYFGLKNKYRKWRTEIIKEIPGLIDKLRISFAGGRDYLSAFKQARENSGLQLGVMLDKLIGDLQYMRPVQALDFFAEAFGMTVMTKFTSAVKIAIEYGYEPAENYFKTIESDINEIRRVAVEELTKSKPEKVYELYLIMLSLAVGALLLKGWEIFSSVNEIM